MLHVRGAFGGKPETLEYERAHPHRGDENHTLTGRVVQRREVVGIPDVLMDEGYQWAGQKIEGFRALLGVPILADGGRLLGVLGISWAQPEVFTDDQVRLVSAFAAEAALAITNARLFQAVERQRHELARFLSPAIADLISSERWPSPARWPSRVCDGPVRRSARVHILCRDGGAGRTVRGLGLTTTARLARLVGTWGGTLGALRG